MEKEAYKTELLMAEEKYIVAKAMFMFWEGLYNAATNDQDREYAAFNQPSPAIHESYANQINDLARDYYNRYNEPLMDSSGIKCGTREFRKRLHDASCDRAEAMRKINGFVIDNADFGEFDKSAFIHSKFSKSLYFKGKVSDSPVVYKTAEEYTEATGNPYAQKYECIECGTVFFEAWHSSYTKDNLTCPICGEGTDPLFIKYL